MNKRIHLHELYTFPNYCQEYLLPCFPGAFQASACTLASHACDVFARILHKFFIVFSVGM